MTGSKAQIQEVKRTINRINVKESMSRLIIFKLFRSKYQERFLKDSRGKGISYLKRSKENYSRLLIRNQRSKREQNKIFKGLKEKNTLMQNFISNKIIFQKLKKNKPFLGQTKSREFIAIKPVLQKMLKEVL